MVSHQHGAVIANFSMHKPPRQGEAHRRIESEAKLFHAQEDIFQRVAPGDAVEPATHREISDGNLHLAQGLNGLG